MTNGLRLILTGRTPDHMPAPRASVPLDRALLCADCQAIHEAGDGCPACGSRQSYPVASWLNKPSTRQPRGVQ